MLVDVQYYNNAASWLSGVRSGGSSSEAHDGQRYRSAQFQQLDANLAHDGQMLLASKDAIRAWRFFLVNRCAGRL